MMTVFADTFMIATRLEPLQPLGPTGPTWQKRAVSAVRRWLRRQRV